MTESQASKLVRLHDKEMSELESLQQANRDKQARKLQEDLARKKLEWEQQKAREKNEMEEVRDHEIKLAKLVAVV